MLKEKTAYPSVLFIIPSYNRKDLLHRAITSIQGTLETESTVHILAVSDGSTDDTGIYLSRYDNSNQVFYIHMPKNSGVNRARQAGMAWALARDYAWVSFLDDDDRISPDCIRHFYKTMEENPDQNWIALPSVSPAGDRLSKFPAPGPNDYLVDYMGKRVIRGDFQHFVRAEALQGLSFLMAFKNGEEWYFWCKLAQNHPMYISPCIGVIKEYLPGGLSQNAFNRDKKIRVTKYKVITLKKIMPSRWYAKIQYSYCKSSFRNQEYLKAYAMAKKTIESTPFLFKVYPYYLLSMICIAKRQLV